MYWYSQGMDGLFPAPNGPGVQLFSLCTYPADRKLQVILFVKRSFGLVGWFVLRDKVGKIRSVKTNLGIAKKQGRRILYRYRIEPLQLRLLVDQGPSWRSLHPWEHAYLATRLLSRWHNLSLGQWDQEPVFNLILGLKTIVQLVVRRLNIAQPAQGLIRPEPRRILHLVLISLENPSRCRSPSQTIIKPLRQGPNLTDLKLHLSKHLRPMHIKTASKAQKHPPLEVAQHRILNLWP